ncbi:crosslink repair DNA glycosylase YcaQ family protein [Streptomyces sp. B6B3]|uniref:DNA glycosylase AlkZ-like family protein n=1 Tax=Streptomyces sp. B6B3 TaxID=3153570 RepID=UPI00325D132F
MSTSAADRASGPTAGKAPDPVTERVAGPATVSGAPPGGGAAENLTWAQVLNWRLVRQHLVPRLPTGTAVDVASALCGLHAQVMSSAELSVAARLDEPRDGDLAEALWTRRELVKLWAVRGTLHLLPAAELDEWLALFGTFGTYGMTDQDTRRLVDLAGRALHGKHLGRTELARAVEGLPGGAGYGRLLTESWGTALKPVSFSGRLCFAPGEGTTVRFTHPGTWVGADPSSVSLADARLAVARRALAMHGAASLEDLTRWLGAGARQTKGLLDALGPEVATVTIDGQPGYALAAQLPGLRDASEPRTVRLLPAFDQWTITLPRTGGAGLPLAHRPRVYRPQGWLTPVILVGHRIRGVWASTRQGNRLRLTLEGLGRGLPRWAVRAAEREAERLADLSGRSLALTWDG